MIWEQLLEEFTDAVKGKDTLKLTMFILKIIKLEDLDTFQPENTKVDFLLIQNTISDNNGIYEYEIFQQFFLICLDLLTAIKLHNISNQIKCHIELINLLSKKLLDEPSFYLTPIIIITKNLRLLVFRNYQPNNSNLDLTIVDNFTNAIQRPFKLLISNKSDNQINISAIHIFASHLFSIYFKYNKLNAVINLYKVLFNTILTNSISTNKIDMNPILPTASLFNYFIGLSLLVQSNYDKSFKFFQEAYNNKHSKSLETKILFYLLPLNYILKRKLPTNEFFNKNPNLNILKPIFIAIKKLDLTNFNIQIEKFKYMLLKFKVYSIYIKFYIFLELEILKTTYNVYQESIQSLQESKKHIVPLSIFQIGLSINNNNNNNNNSNYSIESTESILCRMISMDLIKGYISHSNKVIVLSKTKAFV